MANSSKPLFHPLLETVLAHDKAHHLLARGDKVLVAVSGGPDSVALLHILRDLAPVRQLELAMAHVDHCLRPESADDATFVAQMARDLELPLFDTRNDVRAYGRKHRLSLEEAGHRVRYAFFAEIAAANGFDKIALGHQAEDNAELVLINLFRGSGPRGLGGMSARTPAGIIRPLLPLRRREIVAYLEDKGLTFRIDASNNDRRFTRNRIRLDVLPLLKREFNPNIVETLNRTAQVLAAEDDWIENLIREGLAAMRLGATENSLILSNQAIEGLAPAEQRRLIRRAIAEVKGDLRRITLAHVDGIRGVIEGQAPVSKRSLPGAIQITREYDLLKIEKGLPRDSRPSKPMSRNKKALYGPDFEYALPHPGEGRQEILLPQISRRLVVSEVSARQAQARLGQSRQVAYFDAARLFFPLTVRSARPGDKFKPLGMSGRQKIGDFFTNAKIRVPQRARYPLLISGTDVIWIAGVAQSETAKLTSWTRKVIMAELFLA